MLEEGTLKVQIANVWVAACKLQKLLLKVCVYSFLWSTIQKSGKVRKVNIDILKNFFKT